MTAQSSAASTPTGPGGPRIRVGSAPDSWGVWFPDDPVQVPWQRFLDEVSASGYEWIELGPYGYLPTDPSRLADELGARGLRVSAGTVFEHLHRPDSWDAVWRQVTDVAALTRAVGGTHVVVIPDVWRDHRTGAAVEPRDLPAEGWARLATGMDRLGRAVQEEYGLSVAFHPHADSHVGHQHDIERFLAETDPSYVPLCLDTGHVSYYGGDNLDLIRRYPERIGYLHLKQVDPAVIERVHAEDIPFPQAVQLGAMIEPPNGVPDLPPLLEAVEELGLDVFAIVEHDLYPCDPDLPFGIAQRTHRHIGSCGLRSLEIGTPRTAVPGGGRA
ncbi:sugar phosphate isomerase/epimerase family protein [Geodermatophilus marinus]|uniref:sugar phosphate isomerase/epimerase family protein n=1 Tax=Geodermatophilus sp. LHW52908 TaxID=2303986 RepID=UPI000E3D0C25|nr:sugar phosphate isomerase/epimerase [Geodermatophilus sp. LHW52908]RFU22002.1 2-keto-myo-inositol dehydratase [Geodermatophilus sp. LHW52908]